MNASKEPDPRTYAIIGAAMAVHRELGPWFLEAVYHDALEQVFIDEGIPYRREVPLPVYFRGRRLGSPYRADFVCHDAVVVELKAQRAIGDPDYAQVLHCLRTARHEVGLLLNFGADSLQVRRFAV